MFDLLMILMILPLLGCFFVLTSQKSEKNAGNVCIFTLISGIALIISMFAQFDLNESHLQYLYSFSWPKNTNIYLSFGVDIFSLLTLLGVYISALIALVGLPEIYRKNKYMFANFLYFLWNITGLFAAADVVSFYIFFAGMLVPLLLLVGTERYQYKKTSFYMFFFVNLIGIILFFTAVLFTYKYYQGNISLQEMSLIKMPRRAGLLIWMCICGAFVARIPIWPFHYWLSSVCSSIRNPLVYIVANLVPLTGLYGFIRCWQITIAGSMMPYIPFLSLWGILTMVCIVLIGVVHKEFLYKLFSYMTMYYLLFLLAVVLLSSASLTDMIIVNIAYSLFIFMIVNTSLIVLNLHLRHQCLEKNCDYRGILTYTPRLAYIFAFFVLIAIGLPISSMFWNNFIIISELFKFSFSIGITVMFSISAIAVSMLYELYILRNLPSYRRRNNAIEDISKSMQAFFIAVISVLLLSFFNPLWFVF